jgi:hypothetical protein
VSNPENEWNNRDEILRQPEISPLPKESGFRRKKAKQPKDELEQLERQRKILEEKKKIRDLEKDLKGTTPENQNP